jgi:hypothetical protein
MPSLPPSLPPSFPPSLQVVPTAGSLDEAWVEAGAQGGREGGTEGGHRYAQSQGLDEEWAAAEQAAMEVWREGGRERRGTRGCGLIRAK